LEKNIDDRKEEKMKYRKGRPLIMLTAMAFLFITMTSNFHKAHGVALSIEEGEKMGIPYMSGGVGLNERSAMEDKARDYNLKFVFAAASGSYLDQVEILIQNRAGKVMFEGKSNGPWYFVDLPQGEYKVVADHAGDKKVRQIVVRDGLKTVLFHWKK
jgi:hypothetical protein